MLSPYICCEQIRTCEPIARVDNPKISIVILNLNKSFLTAVCELYLRKYVDLAIAEIVIVDNGSSPDQFDLLVRLTKMSRIVRQPSNCGFGEGNNRGVEHCKGELILFLNNDVFVTEGWLDPLLRS